MKKNTLPSSVGDPGKNELVRIRRFAQITLPTAVCKRLNLHENDYCELSIVANGILLQPVKIVRKKIPKKH